MMLTRRQAWRRQVQRNLDREFSSAENSNISITVAVHQQMHAPQADFELIKTHYGRSSGTVWQFESKGIPISANPGIADKPECHGEEAEEPKKRVQFEPRVKVVLIPSRPEYVEAKLANDLWWANEDFEGFKHAAVNEIKVAMELLHVNFKSARHALYEEIAEAEALPSPRLASTCAQRMQMHAMANALHH